ncbi:MAG TPA: N-acetylmuramoyl-L-alanine amidase [Rhizomicrobium sp.]|nr:N-acetylmuramoyl-L-alanine amidase [Rhizomicrobium sp.]
MRRASILALCLLTWAAAAAPGTAAAPAAATASDPIGDLINKARPAPPTKSNVPLVIGARIHEQAARTRFIVELSDPVAIRVFTLANPNRVVIDMPTVVWRLQNAQQPSGTGAVRSYRYGLFRPGNSRFVIDLASPVTVGAPTIVPPQNGYGYRIVLDLVPVAQTKFEDRAGWPADLRARELAAQRLASVPAPQTQVDRRKDKRKIVVIDAGHGGIDSGTRAANGLLEKDVVLDEAIHLRDALASRGYIVHLTRDTDTYIPLRERVNIGRGYHADLFISIHADSNPNTAVNGASIYTLSESGSDREAAALARKENQSDIIAGVDLAGQDDSVSHILIDLAQRDTMNRSSRFAEKAVASLGNATDILARQPHRSAGFVVLKAPDVPAVLIELGYLSNPADAAQMATQGWRSRVANAIANAVDRHFAATVPAQVLSQ